MSDTIVKGLLTANTTLSGTFTTVDGVVLVAGNRCLVVGQSDPVQNGFWYVQTGAWTRDTDPHLEPGAGARVSHGNYYRFSVWVLNTDVDIVAGTNTQIWELSYLHRGGVPSGSLERAVGTYELKDADTGAIAGTYQNPLLTVNASGKVTGIVASNIIQSYIEGLDVEFVSTTQIKVYRGAAYVPGYSKVVTFGTDTTLTPTRAASTTYYVYLYEVNGTGQIEVDTTAPGTPYLGIAKVKGTDSTRRYIGKIATDASSNYDSTTLETLAFATTDQRGIIELATTAETRARTDASRGITPATLATGFNLDTDQYDGSASITNYPVGPSTMRVLSTSTGWPTANNFTVITEKTTSTSGYQFAARESSESIYYRRWNTGSSVWGSWFLLMHDSFEATNAEIAAGTNAINYVTPAGLMYLMKEQSYSWLATGLTVSPSIPSLSDTRMDSMATVEWNPSGAFTASTGRFTPPSSDAFGLYLLIASASSSAAINGGAWFRVAFFKAGATDKLTGRGYVSGTTGTAHTTGSALVVVSNTGHYLETYVRNQDSTSRNMDTASNTVWFMGARVARG